MALFFEYGKISIFCKNSCPHCLSPFQRQSRSRAGKKNRFGTSQAESAQGMGFCWEFFRWAKWRLFPYVFLGDLRRDVNTCFGGMGFWKIIPHGFWAFFLLYPKLFLVVVIRFFLDGNKFGLMFFCVWQISWYASLCLKKCMLLMGSNHAMISFAMLNGSSMSMIGQDCWTQHLRSMFLVRRVLLTSRSKGAERLMLCSTLTRWFMFQGYMNPANPEIPEASFLVNSMDFFGRHPVIQKIPKKFNASPCLKHKVAVKDKSFFQKMNGFRVGPFASHLLPPLIIPMVGRGRWNFLWNGRFWGGTFLIFGGEGVSVYLRITPPPPKHLPSLKFTARLSKISYRDPRTVFSSGQTPHLQGINSLLNFRGV